MAPRVPMRPPAQPVDGPPAAKAVEPTRAAPEKDAPRYEHASRHRMAGRHEGLVVTEHHRGRRVK